MSFSATNMKPEFVCAPPVKPATFATFGFARMMRIISVNLSFIAWNDVVWSAWMPPIMRPVSCCGKKPFGTTMYSAMFSAIVATSVIRIVNGWRSAHDSVRS